MPHLINTGTNTCRALLTRCIFQLRGASTQRTFSSPPPPAPAEGSLIRRILSRSHDAPEPKNTPNNRNRGVIVTGLDPDVTLPELLQSIARTAPVGAIASAFLLPSQRQGANKGAKVNFSQRRAAMQLVRLSREKTFLVRGRTPFVTEHRKALAARGALRSVPPPLSECFQTRVLVLEGPAGVEGFDEVSIRRLLVADEVAMRDSGPFGMESEGVITTDSPDGTRRSIEWRFNSYSAQALPFKKVIKRHFGEQLRVTHGRDPCCAEDIYDAAWRASTAQGGLASDIHPGQQDAEVNVDEAKGYEDRGDDGHANLIEDGHADLIEKA
ncbi:hypothetical protein VPNG_08333 [Cytospora leucostoma]|uniref:Uncharacterized protein n=1 Tax=Cytospora leucostoma TaxID=1230097 RepID=A0A423W9K0_9PEZI|nr:hypothetical protein VPNG_08333 [Cytospora leucostoma]